MRRSQPPLLTPPTPLISSISCSDTGEIIKNLTQNKAPRDEGIKTNGLKNLKKVAVYILHTLQPCINTIYFPIAWKEAKNHNISQTRKDLSLPDSHCSTTLPTNTQQVSWATNKERTALTSRINSTPPSANAIPQLINSRHMQFILPFKPKKQPQAYIWICDRFSTEYGMMVPYWN
jgi:hypothetical protein